MADISPEKRRLSDLDYLDGIRGLSALYILLHHACMMLLYDGINENGGWQGAMRLLRPLAFGQFAVDMFIVLSGCCLMLPVANTGFLKGGFVRYIKRRAMRILPPYYVALIFTLAVIVSSRFLFDGTNLRSDWLPSVPAAGDIASHFFLVHNLINKWSHSINAPLWSVATEWQIYFVFPLVLLPAWKKGGVLTAVVAAFSLGYASHFLVPGGLGGAAPWMLGLFALGMIAGVVNASSEQWLKSAYGRMPWGLFCLALTTALVIIGSLTRGWYKTHMWIIDPIFGLASLSLILYCMQKTVSLDRSPQRYVLNLFSSRLAVGLGAFSYSLYLIHYPLLEIVLLIFRKSSLSTNTQIVVIYIICVPIIIGLAYLFHLAFERPFMPYHPRSIQETTLAAEVSPAP